MLRVDICSSIVVRASNVRDREERNSGPLKHRCSMAQKKDQDAFDEHENPFSDNLDAVVVESSVLKRDLADFSEFEAQPLPPWRQRCSDIDNNPIKITVSTFCTVMALFLPDVRGWILSKQYDSFCSAILTVVFVSLRRRALHLLYNR